MSNKKQTKKTAAKEKKSPKGIIIAAVALLLAAAIIVAVVLIRKDGGTQNPSGTEIETLANDGGQYTYAKYKGSSLPVEFVEILNKAEADSAAACKNRGVVLEIGDREISVPEFVMYYYDEYSYKVQSAQYSIQQTGANRTGFELDILPSEQASINSGETWEETFIEDAIAKMRDVYMIFDLALKEGTKLDVIAIAEILQNIDMIESAAEGENTTADESLASFYGEGMTAAMYFARDIMMYYANAYETEKMVKMSESYTEKQLNEVIEHDKHDYTVFLGRVYMIEGEYNEAEATAITNEQEFLAYASKNYPMEGYDAESMTKCVYTDRETISSAYGEEVGAWIFNDARKAGDIAVVQGALFTYLCYIEQPPHLATSRNIITCLQEYPETVSEEEKENLYNNIFKKYDEWKKNDGTQQGFLDMSMTLGGTGETAVRAEEYYYEVSEWIFDPVRRPGDHEIIDTEAGCVAVYYVGNNEEDFDWKYYAGVKRSELELKDYYETIKASDYRDKRDAQAVKDACDGADVFIQRKIDKLKAETTTQAS
ncbi:MAG: hypothetical protein E7516_09390 [Ruminococcaceae bacterium]|nr:hypothetical protein [Oscillospiraceae bacterium]